MSGDTVNQETTAFLSGVTNPVLSKPFDFRELQQLVVSITTRSISGEGPPTGPADQDLNLN